MKRVWIKGDVYKAKTGEILEVDDFSTTEFFMLVRHPLTLEVAEYRLQGPIGALDKFAEDSGFEKINLATHKPTGLTP